MIEKVKISTLCLDVESGGIAMISTVTQQKVRLIKWLHRLLTKTTSSHFHIVDSFFKPVGGLKYFMSCNINQKLFIGLDKIQSSYWKRAMIAWLNLDKSDLEVTMNHVIPIFNNNQILYHKKPIFLTRWIIKGIKYTHQMFNNNIIKSFEEIKVELGSYGSLIFDYLIVKNAILNSESASNT